MNKKEECIICFYDKPIEEYICFSCGHKVCSTCYPLMRNICPICRYVEAELIDIRIIVPENSQTNHPQEHIISYKNIIINLCCGIFCCMMIYVILLLITN